MAKRRRNKPVVIIVGALVLLIVVVVIGKAAGWIGQPDAREVETAAVKRTTIVEKVSASGTIQPETEVTISPDVPGEIVDLEIEEGDSVKIGDFLLRIRPDNYQTALTRAQANLNQQQAQLAESKARLARAEANKIRLENEFKRQKPLYEDSVISVAAFEQAKADFDIALQDLESARQTVRANEFLVQSARANVSEASENLSLTSIFAPMEGVVSKLSVEKGERVVGTSQMAGTELLRIADLSRMEVRVDVNENDIIRVAIGDTAIIDVDSYSYMDKEFKGVVTSIANTANPKATQEAVTEFEVRIRILNDSYRELMQEGERTPPFRPGMTASVDIVTETRGNVLSVPLAAVTTRSPEEEKGKDGGAEKAPDQPNRTDNAEKQDEAAPEEQEVVFLMVNGKAQMQPVETGISDFDNIQILSGLEEGQTVITGPFLAISKLLKDGDLVEQKKEEDKKVAGRGQRR